MEETHPSDVLEGVSDAFIGLSRMSLQDAKLARLNKLANLRKASRQHRETLSEIRSAMAATNHEIDLIERQLKHVLGFPTPVEASVIKTRWERWPVEPKETTKKTA